MTFEEFILKKKINLEAFKKGNPDLFNQFIKHYELMGSKSFDHSKKFLFNQLRNLYPIIIIQP